MDRPSSRNLSIPTRPETGLAEWAEKIKAIQRQVDDDEAEDEGKVMMGVLLLLLLVFRRTFVSGCCLPARESEYTS